MTASKDWWREPEWLILAALVLAAYFTRAGLLPLRGEEPTRAQMAFEMSYGHDWIVPRQQGEPFLIRPPLQSWVIAASCLVFGNWGPLAVRFPSLLATLLTALIIYGYSRNFLSRIGALTAGAAFVTMPEIFQMGRQAETEAVFILLVSASLLLWHWGILRRWPRWLTFAIGYSFMALAMLTKGIQAPIYFMGSIVAYLAITGEFELLFSGAHLVGCLIGLFILSSWTIPYANRVGWSNMPQVWFGDPAITYNGQIANWRIGETLIHLLRYPAAIVVGTLPWSLLLVLYLGSGIRSFVREHLAPLGFAGICLAVAFPTCWIPVGGLPRYFAPLYPCLAVVIGASMQWIVESKDSRATQDIWRWALWTIGILVAVLAVIIGGVSAMPRRGELLSSLAEPAPVAILLMATCGFAAARLFYTARRVNEANAGVVVFCLAAVMAVTFSGWITDVRSHRSENIEITMRDLKQHLPPAQQLYSLDGHAAPLFAYYYGLPLIRPYMGAASHFGTKNGVRYFCFIREGPVERPLPFAWKEIGTVPIDRNHHQVPDRAIVVGVALSHYPG